MIDAKFTEDEAERIMISVPKPLIDTPQWVAWHYERCRGRNRLRKPPLNPNDDSKMKHASPTDPRTWGSFEKATDYAIKREVNGIGFVFRKEDPFVGIDLDDVLFTAPRHDLIEEVLKNFNTYMEVSPLGKGIHAYGLGKLEKNWNHRIGNSNIELYDSEHYLTVTGHTYRHRALNDIQSELKYLQSLLSSHSKPESEVHAENLSPIGNDLEIYEIIRIGSQARNGDKFKKLYRGNSASAGYGSRSEADAAFCQLLVFYTGKDPEKMFQILELSGLKRPKWFTKRGQVTWIEREINNAIQRQVDVYKCLNRDNKTINRKQKIEKIILSELKKGPKPRRELIELIRGVSNYSERNITRIIKDLGIKTKRECTPTGDQIECYWYLTE